jgi:acetyl esterase
MTLSPQVQKFLQQINDMELPPLSTLSAAEARLLATKVAGNPLHPLPIFQVNNLSININDTTIPIRVYIPNHDPQIFLPVLVYFHGGGWVLGNLDSADHTCRYLANSASCIVVSVNYRKAPEFKFPTAVNDAFSAVCWVVDNCREFMGDPNRIGIAGDSAGGNLAAVVSLMFRERILHHKLLYQILIYPVTCYQANTPSYQQYGGGECGLSAAEMQWFWQQYLTDENEGKNPYASPLFAENLAGLPPAFIITAEYDILRSEAEEYALKLQDAGVSVQLKQYDGMIHSFVGLALVVDGGKEALRDIAAYMRKMSAIP